MSVVCISRKGGLLYTQFGEIYRLFYDHNKSLAAYQSAFDYYSKVGLESHKAYALHDIGVAYGNLDDFQRAVDHFDKALSLAEELKDENLEIICYQNLIMLYDMTYEYDKCSDIGRQRYKIVSVDKSNFKTDYAGL